MSMCTSSNLLDAEHDTVLGHACGESVFSCQFEAGFMVRRKLLQDLAEVTFSLASGFYFSMEAISILARQEMLLCISLSKTRL